MKNYIRIVLLSLLFISPVVVEIELSITCALLTTGEIQSLLRQLIALLEQEVQMLVAQLKNISDNQSAITVQLQQMNHSVPQPTGSLPTGSPLIQSVVPNVVPIAINVNGNEDATTTITLFGNNCTTFIGDTSVRYSDGSLRKEIFSYHTLDGNDHGTNKNGFAYRFMDVGTSTILLTSDNLTKELDFNIIPCN